MRRIFEGYVAVLKVLVALLLAGMVVLVFGNVVLRYAFNLGITVSEELSRIFFVWLTFLGATVAVWERGHIGVDTLLRVVPEKVARLLLILAYALMLVAIALLIQGACAQTFINMHAAPTPSAKPDPLHPEPSTSRIVELLAQFQSIMQLDPQPRGYAFEAFLKAVFDAWGMQARRGWRNTGEQIDGSFLLGGQVYPASEERRKERFHVLPRLSGRIRRLAGKRSGDSRPRFRVPVPPITMLWRSAGRIRRQLDAATEHRIFAVCSLRRAHAPARSLR